MIFIMEQILKSATNILMFLQTSLSCHVVFFFSNDQAVSIGCVLGWPGLPVWDYWHLQVWRQCKTFIIFQGLWCTDLRDTDSGPVVSVVHYTMQIKCSPAVFKACLLVFVLCSSVRDLECLSLHRRRNEYWQVVGQPEFLKCRILGIIQQ